MATSVYFVSPSQEMLDHAAGSSVTFFQTFKDVTKQAKRQGEELWVVPNTDAIDADSLLKLERSPNRRLLVLDKPKEMRRLLLQSIFATVVGAEAPIKLLPGDELVNVLVEESRNDFFIGGFVDPDDEVVVLYRGNLQTLLVPFDTFRSAVGSRPPDFSDFEVTDCGQTIRLGSYEAAADALLFELDPEFRRREKKRRLKEDKSLGASIRRLRLMKKMKLSDFKLISEKELGRIERGEVQPHDATLEKIARELGVPHHALEEY